MSNQGDNQQVLATAGFDYMFGDEQDEDGSAEAFHSGPQVPGDVESELGAPESPQDGGESDDDFLEAFFERLAGSQQIPSSGVAASANEVPNLMPGGLRENQTRYVSQLQIAHFNLPGPSVRMPWETGPLQMMFGVASCANPWGTRAQVPPLPEKEVLAVCEDVDSAAFSRRVVRVRRLEVASETALRARAVERWLLIVKMKPEASDVGRMLLNSVQFLCSNDELSMSIKDVLAPKSTRTLLKRGADLTKYVLWCTKKGTPPFPVVETMLYSFLCESRLNGCAATFPSSIRSAINFCGGMLGMDGALLAGSSKRIAGLVHDTFTTKAPLRQMKTLKLDMVEFLERVLKGTGPIADRVFSGFCLLCVFCRLRFSDGQLIAELSLDLIPGEEKGYIEGKQKPGKTATTKEKKSALLPIAGPVQGLTPGKSWAVIYIRLLEDEGILVDGKIVGEFLLTNPKTFGGWGERKVCSTEAAAWLRELLIQGGFTESEARERATHSLKSTLLSWLAKFGVDRDSRKALGFHLNKADETMALYSRDMMAKPLRDLDAVLDAIRRKVFNPDLTRSGYFVTAKDRNAESLLQPVSKRKASPGGPAADKLPEADDSSSSGSSSSSEAPSDKDFEFDEQLAEASPAAPRRAAGNVASNMVQHVRYGTLHLISDSNMHKLACGHPHGDATWTSCGRYRAVAREMKFHWPECTGCFGTQVHSV